MRMTTRGTFVAATCLFVACGVGSSSTHSVSEIHSGTPTGTIGGQSWTMTQANVTSDGTTLTVNLYGDPGLSTCPSPASPTTGSILFSVPAKVAATELSLSLTGGSNSQTVTFVTPPANNDIATDGIIDVSAVSSTSVTIGLLANGSSGDTVNGTFTSTICQ